MKSSLLLLRKFLLYIFCINMLSIYTFGVRGVGAACIQPFLCMMVNRNVVCIFI
jgi:hypothetical protein